jgi:hypothetical protein
MIAFLAVLFRVLFVLLVVRLLLRGIATWVRGQRATPAAGSGNAAADMELVRDRICNTFVPRKNALRATLAGREEYFCGPACRDRARTALDSGAAAVQSQGLR